MKTAVLAFLLAAPAAAEDYALPPPPPGPHVDYSADKAEYDAEHSALHLSGSVVLKETTMTIKGEDLWVDTARRVGRSDAPVLMENGASAAYGDSGEFDFVHETGRLSHVSADAGGWNVRAREARVGSSRRTQYRGADFTSCDSVPPHYRFHSSSAYVVPKKYLLGWNTFFYLGPVPVFYTPILYKSLESDPALKWRFQPGYDHRNGAFLKGTLTTRFSTTTYSKVFDDYYSNMGFGYGGELDHFSGQESRGSLYGYRIKEAGTANDRWGLFGSGYRNLVSSTAFQGRLQFQSDPLFTNDYARSDVFRLTPELVNSAALVHRFSQGTARLLYARNDVQDPTNAKKFVRNTESAPRAEYQSTQLKFGALPWLNSFSGFADDNYDRSRGFQQKTVNGAWEATRSFPLAKGVSFTPKFDYGETFYDRLVENSVSPSTVSYVNAFVGRWTGSGDLRFNTPLGNVDAAQTYTRRLKPDDLTEDTSPADKGVETNLFTLTDVFVPLPRVWARVGSGYDFRTFRDRALSANQRIQPIAADTSWQATRKFVIVAHDDYQPGMGNRSVITDLRWGEEKGPSVGGGFQYNLATPGTYYQSVDFAIASSSPSWRVAVALRTVVESPGGFGRAHGLRLFEKELIWTRRWHDFYTKVVGRLRPGGVGEFTASVELKFGTGESKQAPRRDWESEWYPGRAKEDGELRP